MLVSPLLASPPLHFHSCLRLLTYTHSLTDRANECFDVNYFGSMRFIQTFLPALREAPGQGARIVYIRAHYAPNYVVLITWYLTPKRRGTDLTCLPTYQTTYQPPTLHVLSIPRLQTNSSPENRPIHPSCSSMHQVRASCKSRASLA